MSFWSKLFGASPKQTQLMEEPEHELSTTPPDDLMVVNKKQENFKSPDQGIDQKSNITDKKENFDNKDSP